MKKLTAIILTIVMTLTFSYSPKSQEARASLKYITADAFIRLLVTELDLKYDMSFPEPYIAAAVSAGILTAEDFKDNQAYKEYITRTDAAVLINRADEYLHGNTVDTDLLSIVQKKRISDIKKVEESKQDAVSKCFAKGIIKGYSNGYYIQNRSFKGDGYVTKATAKSMIDLILNPSKRAKLSPDGMLIRTTNLPKNADKYEYILACYPNKFYERQFEFMRHNYWKSDTDDWAYPVDMKNETFRNWNDSWPLSEEMNKYLYDWADMAEKYLHYIFNVNYKTIDDKWIDRLASIYAKNGNDMSDIIKTYYAGKMKSNHVIVESSIIVVEPSTFYSDGNYCMRAYVKYRIKASDITVDQSKLIYSQYPVLDNLKSGVWREGIFDIRFDSNNGFSGDGSDFAISDSTHFVDK